MVDKDEFIREKYIRVEIPQVALSQPQFIIESHGVYYLTVAVWAYDPKAVTDPLAAAGVAAIEAQYNDLVKTDAHRDAVQLPPAMIFHTAQQTWNV